MNSPSTGKSAADNEASENLPEPNGESESGDLENSISSSNVSDGVDVASSADSADPTNSAGSTSSAGIWELSCSGQTTGRLDFSVRTLTGPDVGRYVSIAGESLLCKDPASWRLYLDRIGYENSRVVCVDGQPVGGLAFYRMGQWFGGKPLSCAGVSGVAVSPTHRSTGACKFMLQTLLRELYDEGLPIASLYASTQSLYRKLGFQQAGTQTLYEIPISSLDVNDRSTAVHRFDEAPIQALDFVCDQRAAVNNGCLQRTAGLWQRLTHPYDGKATTTYLVGDRDKPTGFVILKSGSRELGVPQPLTATDIAATTPQAMRRLLTLIRDHRSMTDRFQWFGAPNDPLIFYADEQRTQVLQQMRWLLRILNVPSALAGRGYHAAADATLDFQVVDEWIEENSGRWRLRVRGGQGEVQPGGNGSIRLNVRELAPLFSSLYSATELVKLGVIECDQASQLTAADAVFTGPAPWVPELY